MLSAPVIILTGKLPQAHPAISSGYVAM